MMLTKLTRNSNFITRLISSIGIILYFVILFIFSWLGDKDNSWSPIAYDNRNIFAWMQLVLFIPIIFLAAVEINNIYFKRCKNMFFLTLFCLLVTILTPSSILICCQYVLINGNDVHRNFIFLLTLFIVFIVSNLLLVCLLFYQKFKPQEALIQLFMFNIFCIFAISFFYVSIVKSWSTLLIIFLLPVLNDTFAYLGGMLFGRRKMTPYISPKKTIEGAVIGVIAAVGISLVILTSYAFAPNQHHMLYHFFGINFKQRYEGILPNQDFANKPLWWVGSVVILLALSIFSILGDLSFSGIKRKYGIKDFSSIIPGHGGILDRFDSHTFVYSLYFIISIGVGFFAKSVSLFGLGVSS